MTSWRELVQGDAGKDDVEHFRVVRRRGHELLVLPAESTLAAQAIDIYPAQTTAAKTARFALKTLLRMKLDFGQTRIEIPVDRRGWIGRLIGDSPFAILCGNPSARGRRFVFLAFENGHPAKVIKTGIGEDARNLICREAGILRSIQNRECVPKYLDFEHRGEIAALCMKFVPGKSPRKRDKVGQVLPGWLLTGKTVKLNGLECWQRVRQSDAPSALVSGVEQALEQCDLAPCLLHGDFAPWNIREHNGNWTVLDWERGEELGMPGWDWLHFHIQTDVLVLKKSVQQVFDATIRMMESQAFQSYAAAAGFAGKDRSILHSYLLHAIYVNRQTEGIETLKQMLSISRG